MPVSLATTCLSTPTNCSTISSAFWKRMFGFVVAGLLEETVQRVVLLVDSAPRPGCAAGAGRSTGSPLNSVTSTAIVRPML